MVDKAKAKADPAEDESGPKKSTLAERGAVLPLGLLAPDGKYNKTMSTRPWRMTEEKELAKEIEDQQNLNIAQHVALVIAVMYTQMGHHDFSKLSIPEKRIIISQMYMGDVWYAYCYLRVQVLGPEMSMSIQCPKCSKSYPFPADLNTTEVTWSELLEPLLWAYELINPIKMRATEVKTFKMGPQRWSILEEAADGQGQGGVVKEIAIRASIISINDGDPIAITGTELDEMTKRDIEHCASSVDDHRLGPDMSIELGGDQRCPNCRFNAKRRVTMDWRYDDFFADSSPS